MGWLSGLGNLVSSGLQSLGDYDWGGLTDWLGDTDVPKGGWDMPMDITAYAPAATQASKGVWDTIGDYGSKFGGKLLDSVMDDPMRALGGAFGAGTMLYGMLGDEGEVKAPSMSPAQERMMALIEKNAADTAANKGDEVTEGFKQRVLKALNGEGDVDPRLLREQEDERAAMEARLLRELGSGALTSGQNNKLGGMILNDLNRKQSEARFTNARQILTQDEQSRQGALNQLQGARSAGTNAALAGFKGLGDLSKMQMDADIFNKAKKADKYKSAASGGSALMGYSFGGNKLKRAY